MGSPHIVFFFTEGEGDKGGSAKGRELVHWGEKVMDFDVKLNVADNEGRQTCVGTAFAVLSWATEEEKYYVEEVGDGVFLVSDKENTV